MITSVQRNQENNTPTSENTKRNRNVAQGMGSRLTPKQLSWMCRLLLDVMWYVRVARLMWGMSFVASGWWVLITLRLWCTCHESRGSNTWWEVSKLLLACNLQLLNIDPWNKGCLCMLPWEKQPMHASKFFIGPKGNLSNQPHMQETARLLEKNAHFWLGVGLPAQEICVISGQSNWLLPRIA